MTNDIYDTIKYPDFSLMKKNFLFLQKRKNKMNDLTEQWKKEHSIKENQHYYIKDTIDNIYIDYFWGDGWLDSSNEDVAEVLAKVPDYEKYQKLLSDQLAKIEGEEINAELEAKIKEKETQRIELMMKLNDVHNENHALGIEITKLKELLNTIKTQCELIVPKNGLSPVSDKQRLCKAFLNLINEVLK